MIFKNRVFFTAPDRIINTFIELIVGDDKQIADDNTGFVLKINNNNMRKLYSRGCFFFFFLITRTRQDLNNNTINVIRI